MIQFKGLSRKEKAEYIAIIFLYPLFLLFSQLGKYTKLFGTKKRQIIASVLSVVTLLSVMPLTAFAATPTYDTSWYNNKDKEFTLHNIAELEGFAVRVNCGDTFEGKTVKLSGDFNDTTALTKVIGVGSTNMFKGTFDGNGKTVNLDINGNYTNAGMFGYVAYATIQNLNTAGTIVTESTSIYSGGIASRSYKSTFDNCSSSVNITASIQAYTGDQLYSGGIVGYAGINTTIKNCSFTGSINCPKNMVYSNTGGPIYAGGIVGRSTSECNVQNCFSTASSISVAKCTKGYAGGIIGFCDYLLKTATNCYAATESITVSDCTESYIGGIIGHIYTNAKDNVAENCYYLKTETVTAGTGTRADNITQITAMTKFDMKLLSSTYALVTKLNANVPEGCATWKIASNINNGYPYLYMPACKIENTMYDTVQKAIFATPKETETAITLLRDCEECINISKYNNEGRVVNRYITLDLNGHSLLTDAKDKNVELIYVSSGSKLNIKNGTLAVSLETITPSANPSGRVINSRGCTLNLDNVKINCVTKASGDGKAPTITALNLNCNQNPLQETGSPTRATITNSTINIDGAGNSTAIFAINPILVTKQTKINVSSATGFARGVYVDAYLNRYAIRDFNKPVENETTIPAMTTLIDTDIEVKDNLTSTSTISSTAFGCDASSQGERYTSVLKNCNLTCNSESSQSNALYGYCSYLYEYNCTVKGPTNIKTSAYYTYAVLYVNSGAFSEDLAQKYDGNIAAAFMNNDTNIIIPANLTSKYSKTDKLYHYVETLAISKATVSNGSISVASSAAVGETITVTTTPKTGYKLKEITVYKTGDTNTKVTVTNGAFTMPDYSVTVTASFVLKCEGNHTGGTATCQTKAKCEICGFSYGDYASHDFATTYSKDASGHWYACKTAGCTEKDGFEVHTPNITKATETENKVCTKCGYLIEKKLCHVHSLHLTLVSATDSTCMKQGNKAYYKCSCGAYFEDATGTKEIIDKTSVLKVIANHKYAETYSNDTTNHWHECTVCHAHDNDVAHNGGAATCKTKAKCKDCGVAYGELNANNHTGSTYTKDQNNATCCENGYTGDTYCSDCSIKIANGSVVNATGNHVDADDKWETDETNHWHTCYYGTKFDVISHNGGTATCKAKAKCKDCGVEYGDYENHDFATTYTKDASGHWYACKTTGCTEISGFEAHTPNITKATETDDKICTKCGYVIEAKLGHVHSLHLTFVSETDSTCTKQGNTAYYTCSCGKWFADATAVVEITDQTFVLKVLANHKYAETYSNDTTNHWHECTVCHAHDNDVAHNGGTITCQAKAKCKDCGVEYGDYANHDFATTYTKDTSGHWYACKTIGCTEKGGFEAHTPNISAATETEDKVCTKCGYVIEAKLGHVHSLHLTLVPETDSTCTKQGNTAYYTCSCGKWFSDATAMVEITDQTSVLKVLANHKYAETYSNDTTNHWHECTVCHAHNNDVAHNGGTATCQAKTKCKDCGQEYGDYANHIFATTYTKDETGHWFACKTTGCTEKGSFEAHTPNISAATETEDKVCNKCGYVIEAKLGHVHSLHLTLVPETDSTCAKQGNTAYYTCSCGKWFADGTCAVEITDHNSVLKALAEHTKSKDYSSDATGHWFACDNKECTEKFEFTKHDTENVKNGDTIKTVCKDCGYVVSVKAIPKMLDGENAHWISASENAKEGLTFRSSAEIFEFIDVRVDGNIVDKKNYNLREGSTIVALHEDFLNTLSTGKHTIGIESQTGTATAEFTVSNTMESPKTGDNSYLLLWISLICLSIGAITVIGKTRKIRG